MDSEKHILGRRHLFVLGAAAAVIPACSGNDSPLGGPYGGTGSVPGPTNGSQSGNGGSGGGSGSGSGSGGGSGGSGSGGSGSGSGGSSSSGASGSGSGGAGSSGSGSGSGGTGSSGGVGGMDAGSGSGSGSGSSSGGGGTTCNTSGNVLSLPFSQYPSLMNSGGSVSKNVSGYSDPTCGPAFLGQANIIVINTGSGYSALSTSCTHSCCNVSLQGSQLHCPCHGQNFDLQGNPTTGGRTNQPLAKLQVCSDSTGVYVTY